MGFQRPELLLLLLPAAWLWWWARNREPGTLVVRAVVALLLVAALAGPYLSISSPGRDLVVVVDRSRSMPDEAAESIIELLRLAEDQREVGDRVALVTFGARAAIERPPSEEARFDDFARTIDPDGSDLAGALNSALELIPEFRSGSVLLLSDGEVRGRDPLPTARRAFGREVHIDVRPYRRPERSDLAVERIELPEAAASGEPFQFSAWVRSDRRLSAPFELERGGEVIASGTREFGEGMNRLVFRDRVEAPGIARYTLYVQGVEDRIQENNAADAAMRIDGPRAILVVNHDGLEDTLVRALRLSGLSVDCAAPEAAPLDRLGLEAYRAVILENVAAERVGTRMVDLRRFVLERAGGLLITGGQASFGIGGYHLSPIDEVLPVSMELRKEQRKQGMALAIAMDRSGSMGATVSGGETKMDLANSGAAAAIDLLTDIDAVSVIAVDTAPDVVQEMTPVEDRGALTDRVLRIAPGGGGIYVLTALQAAVLELQDAPQLTKHITLFADAADAEEQQGCHQLVGELVDAGVTLSVIALGTTSDPDARFLEELARIGEGEIYFTTDADDLPRLFAHDTLTTSRSTFVDQPVPVSLLPDLVGLGEIPVEGFPTIGGYNVTYLREGAVAGAITSDESRAPVFAFGYQGLGRAAAYTGQIGGSFGTGVVSWDGFSPFFVTVARWLLGQEAPEAVFGSVYREGRDAVIEVEIDPAAEIAADLSELEAILGLADGTVLHRYFERVSERLFEARFDLRQEGIALPTVKIDERRSLPLAPVSLPYSPEYEIILDPDRGEKLMRALAQESGGEVTPAATRLFRGERGSQAWRSVTREVLLAALLLLLVEIAFRRLGLWRGFASWREERRERRGEAVDEEAQAKAKALHDAPPEPGKGDGTETPAAEKKAPVRGASDLGAALKKARSAARRELDR